MNAVRSIEAVADIGTWSLNETSRYWELLSNKDAGSVRIASSAAGSKKGSGFSPVNSIVLNGKLTAGSQTKSVITITGLVDSSQSGYSIEGASTVTEPTITIDGAKGDISTGTESVANIYKERYEELLKLISDYKGGDSQTTSTAVLAYSTEMELLRQKMVNQGLATFNDDKTIATITSEGNRGYVKVSNVAVSGGNVNLRTDSVTGSGAITANAADKISIDNQSNLALAVENVRILEKGGNFTLNGANQSSKPNGFTGTLKSASNTPDPSISITSKFLGTGGSVTVKETYVEGGVTQEKKKQITPDNTVTVSGVVANDAGNLAIDVSGDLFVTAGSRLAAAGAMKLSATRSVMQSYTSGMRSIGGDIEDLWADAVADYKKNKTSKAGLEVRVPTSGGIIAGSDIFVSADNININGTVQSGYASWTVDLTKNELEQKVSQIKENWIKDGSKRDINPISNDYLISSGGHYKKSDGTYAMAVAVWYDPVNDRVIVDDINPQGGHIYLTGRIASTGGGKLYAASGVADVKIDSGTHSVRLGEITTKNGSGLIEITDTTDPGDGAMAKVYRWERYWVDDQVTTKWSKGIVDKDGNHKTNTESILTGGVRDSFTFNPTQNLSYVWSEGYRTGSVSVATTSQKFKWWELMDSGDPSKWGNVNTTTVKDQALSKGITLQTNDIRSDNYKFHASTVEKQTSTGEWVTTTWTTYDNWTHWSGTYKSYAEKHDTGTKVYTYSVKADESVDVNFLTGTNTIDVTSGADIVLTGKLSAQEGTVNLTAQRNIINDDSDASIVGAKTLNLKAGAAIGEENSAIKIVNSKGEINLSAVASMENAIYLDATNTQEGAVINASDLTARDVILTSRGTVNVTNLTAYEANLVSNAGDIVVSNLDQKNATDEIVRRFDATALNGSVTLSATGDIGIGKIVAGDAVTVTSTGGNVWDALYRDDLDDRNAEEKLRVWKEAGILSSDGTNNGEARYNADVTAQEDIVKADFKRYEDYTALSEEKLSKLTDNQTKDFNSLKARFNGITSADAAVAAEKANADSNLAKTIAAKDNYGWSQTELLYSVSKAIVNPDSSSAPEAGDTNIEAKTISINASQSAGIELNTQTFKFSEIDASTDKGIEAYKVLARADVDDVTWDKENESVTVTLKRPISVKLTDTANTSRLDGKADKGFYVASDEKLRVGNIEAAGATLRLTSAKGIEALAASQNIYAKNITLRGGHGSVGSLTNPVIIRSTGSVALSAEEGIHIKELNGELKLISAATEGVLDLTADKILSVFEESQGAEGYLSAKTILLNGSDDNAQIGTDNTALRVKVRDDGTSSITVNRSKFETFNLEILGEGDYALTLKDNTLEATDTLRLKGEGDLTIAENMTLKSGSTLTLESEKSLSIKGTEIEADTIVLNSEGAVVADNATFKPTDDGVLDVTVSASSDVSLKNTKFEDDDVSLKVTTENGSVNLTRTDTTTPMKVKTLEIGAGKNINIAGNKIASAGDLTLDAGDNLNAGGSSLESTDALSIKASEWLFANDAHFTSASSTLSLTSKNDQIQAIGASIGSNGSAEIRAKEGIDLQDASLTSENGSLTVTSENRTVDLSVVNTRNEIAAKEIAISSQNVNLSRRTVTATDSLNVAATGSIDAPNSTLVAKTGDLKFNADYAINLKLAKLNSETGSLTLTSSKFAVHAFEATLESFGQVTIDAPSASLTGATVTSKGSSISVNAKAAELDASNAEFKAENGDVTLFAESDTNLKDAQFAVSGSGLLSIKTNSGDLDLSSSSTQEIHVNQLTVQSGSNVNLKSRDVATNAALLVKAAGSIEADYALKSQTTLSLEGERGVLVNSGTLTSQNQLILASAGGRIEAQSAILKSETSAVNLTARDIISAKSVTVESPDALRVEANRGMNLEEANLTSNTDVTLTSTEGYVKATGLTLNARTALTVNAQNEVQLKDASLQADNIALNSSEDAIVAENATFKSLNDESTVKISASSDVSLKNAKFEDDGVTLNVTTENGSVNLTRTDTTTPMKVKTLEIGAGKNINIAGNKIASAGDLTLDAGDNLNAGGSSLESTDALSIKASEWLFANDAHFTSASSTLSLTSKNDQIQAIGASIGSNGSAEIRAKEGIDLQDASLTSENGSLTVTSENRTVDLSVVNTRNEIAAKEIAISSQNVNLSRRTVTATDSLNVAATGSIDAPNSTLVAKTGDLKFNADYAINLKLAKLNSETGSLTLTSSKFAVHAFEATLESFGQVTIDAPSASLTGATVTSKGSSISVNAKAAELDASNAEFKAENGDVTLFAESDTNLKDAQFAVSGSGLLSIKTNSGDLDLSSSSTQEIHVNQLTVQSGSNVNLKSRDVATNAALLVKAAGSIEADYALKSQTTLSLEGERGVLVNSGTLTSQNQLILASAGGRIEAQSAILKSETSAVNLTARDIISAKSVTVESPDALRVEANRGMNLEEANLTSNTDVTLTSTEGYVKATGLTLNARTALTVNAQNEVQLKDAKLSGMNGTIHLVSTKGDVGFATSSEDEAYLIRAKNLIIEAGRDIDFRGRKAYLGEETVTSRARLLRATIPDGATGMILFESNESIYADGTTLMASSIDLNSSAGDLFARKANFTSSGKFTLSAGSGIDVSETTLTANSTSEKLVLESDFGNVYAKDATLTSPVEIEVTANKDVSLSGATSFTAPKVSLTSEFEDVELSGSVQITSPEIFLTAETGDILLADNAKLTAQDGAVYLDADDDIVQSGNSVITASTLTATADDSIYLESSSGNKVPEVTLNNNYGSVRLNTAVDTTVNINNDRGHFVYGDVWLDAFNSSLTLTEGVASSGQVSIRAKSFETEYLVSDDGVYVSTNFNSDVAGTTSIEIDEIVSAEIGLMTENGSIKVGNLNALDGSVSVYRTSLETEGTITIGKGEATSNGFIYNGNGNITSGLVSDAFMHLMIGSSGTVTQLANTQGSSSYMMRKVSYLTKSINTMTQERANEYDWFPMMDWRKLGYTYVARATDVVRADYHFATAKLTKPFTREDDVIEDNWTASLESPEIEGLSVF